MLRKIWTEEGMTGLYGGIRPTLLMAVPNAMLYYTCYDELVHHVRSSLPVHAHHFAPLLSGGGARLLASTATAPLEYLRTREASLSSKATTTTSLRHILRSEGGLRSLYRGLAPTLWRDVPFSAIYWVCIEQMRHYWWMQQADNGATPTSVSQEFLQSFVNGLVGGTIAACVTTPFDVVKTRQQALPSSTATTTTTTLTNCQHRHVSVTPFASSRGATQGASSGGGTLQWLRFVAQTEGLPGLWRGNVARVAKVAPSCAIMIATYEGGKRILLPDSSL
jgi:solute carrier family 25 protein 39/40